MPLTLTYHDAYLRSKITEEREARAFAEVDAIGTFPTVGDWRSRLARVRAYVIVCLESQGEAGDLFSEKLSAYRKEFDALLVQARVAQQAAAVPAGGGGVGMFTVPLLRG